MKRIFSMLLIILTAFILVSCSLFKQDVKKYVVTFNTNGGSEIESQTVEKGRVATKPNNPIKADYEFVEWQLDGDKYTFNLPVESDITIIAIWKEITDVNKYTVTFDTNGGTDIDSKELNEGELVTKPANPRREGYEFVEWQLDGDKYTFNLPVESDITIIAIWKEITEVITFEKEVLVFDFGNEAKTGYDSSEITFTNGDNNTYTLNKQRGQLNTGNAEYLSEQSVLFVFSPVSGKTQSFVEFDVSNIDKLSKIEFKIASWHDNAFNKISGFSDASFSVLKKSGLNWTKMLTKDDAVNAIDQISKSTLNTVTFNLDGSGIYRLFYDAPSAASGNTTQAIVVDDVTFFAEFETGDNHIVTFDYNYEGAPSNLLTAVLNLGLVEEVEHERLGYEFLGWYLNNELFDFNTKVEKDITLVAKWSQSDIVVTFDYGYLGEKQLDVLIELSTKVSEPTEPQREGYNFVGWFETSKTKDVHSKVNFNNNLTENIRYIAKWEIINNNPDDLVRNDDELDLLYKDLEGKTGEPLVHTLTNIITDTHTTPTNYGDARYALEDSDRHPHNNDMVLTIYDRDMIAGPWNHPNWEREHVWPNSKLGVARADNPTINQASDLHNLRAIVPVVNQRRGNRYFVNTTFNSPLGHQVDSGTYYPGDEDIGDVARIFLYMALRYDTLELTNDHTLLRLEATNNTPASAYMGKLEVLYKWHLLDPVDEFEIRRNDVIASWQGNRNPFIDQPELFEEVFNYLMEKDNNRLLSMSEIKIYLENEYRLEIDYLNFKENKRKYIM